MNAQPHKQIWAIAGPAILANSSAPLVGLVDTWAVGHLPGALHLAAVGPGSVIYLLLLQPLTAAWGLHGLWGAVLVFMGARGLGQALWYPRLERRPG